jgi:signal transduction histidine kinase
LIALTRCSIYRSDDLSGSGLGALVNLSTAVADERPRIARPARERRHGLLTAALLLALTAATVAGVAGRWEASHWQPLWLVLLLAAVTALGELHAVRIGSVYVSSTSCAMLLALALLGPAPAVVIAAGASALDWLVHRKPLWSGLTNVVIAGATTLTGALVIDALAGSGPAAGDGGRFAAAVLLGGLAMATANVVLLGGYRRLHLGQSFRAALAETYLPTIPYHLLGMTLAAGAAQLVVADGVPEFAAVVTVLVLSEFLLRSLASDRRRAHEVMKLTSERANLLEQALTAEVAEREWIAGHVHDETLQTLAVARQDIEEALDGDRSVLPAALEHLDAAVDELRRTLVHVHPGSLSGQGLGPTLEAYAEQVMSRAGGAWTVEVEPGAAEEHQALLYSLARELLGNAAKHANARHVSLTIARDGETVRLTVTDDGDGMAPGALEASGHFGLLTARHRVAAAGGLLTVSSALRRGCRIDVELPA